MSRAQFAYYCSSLVVVLAALAGCDAQMAGVAERSLESAGLQATLLAGKSSAAGDRAAGGAAVEAAQLPGMDRKIIYTAAIDLVVEDFSEMASRVAEVVRRFDGIVADSSLMGSSGETRRARWRLRVPVARFEEFVAAAKQLGELVSASTQSQDVSEEYYDVEARIRNKTKEEERLLKLLEERPGKLEDVIAIERELSRVREELERMQGRMRVLADQTSLTTVELTVTEIKNYQPPQAATLGTRLRRAFDGSLAGIRHTAEAALVGTAALTPWLPVVAIAVALVYFSMRTLARGVSRYSSRVA